MCPWLGVAARSVSVDRGLVYAAVGCCRRLRSSRRPNDPAGAAWLPGCLACGWMAGWVGSVGSTRSVHRASTRDASGERRRVRAWVFGRWGSRIWRELTRRAEAGDRAVAGLSLFLESCSHVSRSQGWHGSRALVLIYAPRSPAVLRLVGLNAADRMLWRASIGRPHHRPPPQRTLNSYPYPHPHHTSQTPHHTTIHDHAGRLRGQQAGGRGGSGAHFWPARRGGEGPCYMVVLVLLMWYCSIDGPI